MSCVPPWLRERKSAVRELIRADLKLGTATGKELKVGPHELTIDVFAVEDAPKATADTDEGNLSQACHVFVRYPYSMFGA